jgi:hypothetical protein
MNSITQITSTVMAIMAISFVAPLSALAAPNMAVPAGLSLMEFKVTGDEFLLLQNNSGSVINDLSLYWLQVYNNVSPLAAGVSASSQQLPAASLQPRQTLLLSASPMQTCGASVAGKLSVSLSDAGGFMQLTKMSISAEGSVLQTPGDFTSWSSNANGIVQNVPSSMKNPRAAFYRYLNGISYAWQQADLDMTDSCQLNIVVAGGLGSSSAVTPLTLAATSPPATILGEETESSGATTARMPAADIGLTAPQVSELLPNPTGIGNDATDEFIELYNPNDKPFDLSGFTLQTGLTTAKNYTFPDGTVLEPRAFKAFYAKDTKLTLSNTSSQAALLDPFGSALSVSNVYTSAKDGIAWAAAKNTWQWTTQPSPGIANIIRQPASKKLSKTTKKTNTKKVAVKGTLTNQAASTTGSSSYSEDPESKATVHVWILAVVTAAALLYGGYEYRRDIALRLRQLGTKLGIRRTNRPPITGGRDD